MTIKTSKGTLTHETLTFSSDGTLQEINLKGDVRFSGAKISIMAKAGGEGDGTVNVGLLDAAGLDLGSVTIDGLLGRILVGDSDLQKPAVKVMAIGGLGAAGTVTEPLVSEFAGSLGKMTVKGDVRSAAVYITGKLGKTTIGGDVEGACIVVGVDKDMVSKNPDASVGSVLIKGNWLASSLVAGVLDATGDDFGRNDTPLPDDTTESILARIAGIVIKGNASGSADGVDHYAFTAQQIGKLSIGGQKVLLTKTGKDNLLLDEANSDFRLVEV